MKVDDVMMTDPEGIRAATVRWRKQKEMQKETEAMLHDVLARHFVNRESIESIAEDLGLSKWKLLEFLIEWGPVSGYKTDVRHYFKMMYEDHYAAWKKKQPKPKRNMTAPTTRKKRKKPVYR